jgi:hypothetical protein
MQVNFLGMVIWHVSVNVVLFQTNKKAGELPTFLNRVYLMQHCFNHLHSPLHSV